MGIAASGPLHFLTSKGLEDTCTRWCLRREVFQEYRLPQTLQACLPPGRLLCVTTKLFRPSPAPSPSVTASCSVAVVNPPPSTGPSGSGSYPVEKEEEEEEEEEGEGEVGLV